ncbi:GNAT family N-acetyltransferase [Pseudarthrobacter sp. J1738]|uniref:GNAT family N-acetyltransferase n=1 Tax=unclassified Pseudarthrobacter TaxID=2647000 RepID=UPI003D2978D9
MRYVAWSEIDPLRALQFSADGFNEAVGGGPNIDQQLASVDLQASLAAMEGNEIVAVTQCGRATQMFAGETRTVLCNTGTAVRDDYRGQGVGKRLLSILTSSMDAHDAKAVYAWGKNAGLSGPLWTAGPSLMHRKIEPRFEDVSDSQHRVRESDADLFCDLQNHFAARVQGALMLDPLTYNSLCYAPGSRVTNFSLEDERGYVAVGWGVEHEVLKHLVISDVFMAPGQDIQQVVSSVAKERGYESVSVLDSGNWPQAAFAGEIGTFVSTLYSYGTVSDAGPDNNPVRTPFYF